MGISEYEMCLGEGGLRSCQACDKQWLPQRFWLLLPGSAHLQPQRGLRPTCCPPSAADRPSLSPLPGVTLHPCTQMAAHHDAEDDELVPET